jgi:hypothetical protein
METSAIPLVEAKTDKSIVAIRNAKEKQWDEIAARVNRTEYGLGRHVDKGVCEAVIALNALDINTTGSCEGHGHRGCSGPWIDISSKQAFVLGQQVIALAKDEKQKSQLDAAVRERIALNRAERLKLFPYLEVPSLCR